MNTNKDLEETLKEKVVPLLEESMEKHWGITIPKIESDITDKLKQSHLSIYVPYHLTFPKAKKVFKKEFFKRELQLHFGNVSQLAKLLGLDRRSIHRTIKELRINMDELRQLPEEKYKQDLVDKTIRSTLDDYKEIIQPGKMEKMYHELPHLSRNIARFLPPPDITWKEAEHEFEIQFLEKVLGKENWNVALTAKKIDLRVETLHRKIKKLGLKKISV